MSISKWRPNCNSEWRPTLARSSPRLSFSVFFLVSLPTWLAAFKRAAAPWTDFLDIRSSLTDLLCISNELS
jgi:hypothetical protein